MGGTNGSPDVNGHIRHVSKSEGLEMLDRLTRQYLGISASDFISAWQAGKFHDENEYPEAVRMSLMIPLAVKWPGASPLRLSKPS